MKDISVIMVEDDNQAANINLEYFSKFSQDYGYNFDIKRYSDGSNFLEEYNKVDIILMDIELPSINGMDVVKKLREKDRNVVVIFVTQLAQYAVEGYSVDAFDFIVKPVSYYNFVVKLSRAISRVNSKREVKLWVNLKGGGQVNLSSARIKYVEIMNHTLIYRTIDGNYSSIGSLAEVKKALSGAAFALCNRCYLVNLAFVRSIKQSIVVVDEDELVVSHLKRKEFLDALNRYLSGDGICE